MTTTYKVAGVRGVFGPGMQLRLTAAQVRSRRPSVEHLGDGKPSDEGVYRVLTTVEFKHGEEVCVVAGSVSKSELSGLVVIASDEASSQESSPAGSDGAAGDGKANRK